MWRIWTGIVLVAALAACAPKTVVSPGPTAVPESAAERSAADARYADAESRFMNKDYEAAITGYREFIERSPAHEMVPMALMKIGISYRALGRYAESREAFESLVSSYPDHYLSPDARVEVLAAYYYEGRFEEVIDRAGQELARIEDDDRRLRVLGLTGDAHMALDDPVAAAAAYLPAYEIADSSVLNELEEKLSAAIRLMTRDELAKLQAKTESDESRKLLETLGRSLLYRRYTIGVLLPLTGPYSVFGQRALTGVELALSEASRQNPLVEAIVKDTGGDHLRAAQAVVDLHDAGVAAIIGPIAAAPSAAEMAQRLRMPIVTLTQREGITSVGDYVFRNFITPRMQAEALVTYAVQEKGFKRFAIFYPEDNYGKTFMNLFWDEVIRQEAFVVGVESYEVEQTDFAGPIKKFAGLDPAPGEALEREMAPRLDDNAYLEDFSYAAGDLPGLYFPLPAALRPVAGDNDEDLLPTLIRVDEPVDDEEEEPISIVDFDAVFIPDAPKTAGLVIPQLAYFDISKPVLMGTNLWHSEELVTMSRDYVQGAIFPDGFFPDSRRPMVSRFVEAYNSVYGERPGFMEAVAYDTASMVLHTVSQKGVRSKTEIRDALLKLADYPGATGLTAFDYDGDARKQPFMISIHRDKLVELPTAAVTVQTSPALTP